MGHKLANRYSNVNKIDMTKCVLQYLNLWQKLSNKL